MLDSGSDESSRDAHHLNFEIMGKKKKNLKAKTRLQSHMYIERRAEVVSE